MAPLAAPNPTTVPQRRTFVRLLGFLKPYRWSLAASVVLAIGSQAAGLSIPWLTGYAIDHALPEKDSGVLAWIVVLVAAIFVPVYFMVLSGDDPEPPPNPIAEPGGVHAQGGRHEQRVLRREQRLVGVHERTEPTDGLGQAPARVLGIAMHPRRVARQMPSPISRQQEPDPERFDPSRFEPAAEPYAALCFGCPAAPR